MAKSKSSRGSSDAKRVSSEKHEIRYTGSKVASGKKGRAAVKKAKSQLGRKTSRGRVEKRAKQVA